MLVAPQGPAVAPKVANITICCITASSLHVDLKEPALNVNILSNKFGQCFIKLNQRKQFFLLFVCDSGHIGACNYVFDGIPG